MSTARKITIQIPDELMRRAQKATGQGITPTIRQGLELIAASHIYDQLRRLRGKISFSLKLKELREDR